MRIRARAIRRAGELLEQVEPAKNQHDNSASAGGGIGRKQAASEAGMSHRQMHTALRVANVPTADFEQQIESNDPPTIPKLAQQGTKPRVPIIDLKGRDPKEPHRSGESRSVSRILFRSFALRASISSDNQFLSSPRPDFRA